jgi:hypothetical protein
VARNRNSVGELVGLVGPRRHCEGFSGKIHGRGAVPGMRIAYRDRSRWNGLVELLDCWEWRARMGVNSRSGDIKGML